MLPAGVLKASLELLAVVYPQLVVKLLTVLQFIDKTLYWQKYIPFLFPITVITPPDSYCTTAPFIVSLAFAKQEEASTYSE